MPDLLKVTEPATKVDPSVYHTTKIPKRSSLLWRSTVLLLVIVILIGIGFLAKAVLAINSTNDASGKKIGFFEQIKNLVVNPSDQLDGEKDDRINILLAGIGGAGHDGAYLADTIIVASIKPSTNEVAMLSIPRDLYVEIPGYGSRKINNALAFGQMKDSNGGGEALLAQTVESVIGIPIHYYARLDFEGFRKAIDDLGGVDITVDQSFSDSQYPDYNHGYQPISFTTGEQHMSGERALQYVRSRHGTNGEGSDFARSKRQQKVLLALKNKFFSLNSLVNPARIVSALDDLGDHNRTNLQIWEIVKIAKLAQNITSDSLITQVLETGPEGVLVSDMTEDGAYILRPKSGDFSEIKYLVKNIFSENLIREENASIEVQNGTSVAGLATITAEWLRGMKYTVDKVGNAGVGTTYEKTTIYDLTGGAKPYTLVSLRNLLNATISPTLPPFMTHGDLNYETLTGLDNATNVNPSSEDIDVVIVVGTDRAEDSQNAAN
ncbi:MAG: LCP family protein [Patescibacteria group bacterium]|nr:LCP family protein [Patescibacteria group bacterium]MDD5715716.1 LCP family protein [Patescibacteria group bacterium]